jgi:transcription elongation factor Elf1
MTTIVTRQPRAAPARAEDSLIAENALSDWGRIVGGTSLGGTTVRQQERAVALRCETCGATFTTEHTLRTHLQEAYHGFQCLHCGALFARRGQMNAHDCQDYQAWVRHAARGRVRLHPAV